MKMKFIVFFAIFSISIFPQALPKIEKIDGVKPWWLQSHQNIEGVLEGIGVVFKGNKTNQNFRTEAMELGKREISSIKNTFIDSKLVFEESSLEKNLSISTIGTTSSKVNAILVDTYEDESNYYAYMVEFFDSKARNEFVELINNNNRKFLENKNNYIKYMNQVVITNKKLTKITINAGKDKEFEKREILNVYRLVDESYNPLTKEIEDFTKKKVGEVIVEEVFDNQALASADIYSSFKIKEGDIVISSGQFEKSKEEIKMQKVDKLEKTYNYNFDYEPQVLNVERAVILGPRQYELSFMTDFDDKLEGEFKTGIFRFVEGSISLKDDRGISGLLKVAFPIYKTANIGLAYERVLDENEEYVMALAEFNFWQGMGILNANYTSPIGKKALNEKIGLSLQYKPDKNVLLGAEYQNKIDNISDDYLALKLNLRVTDSTWLGGGLIWDEDKSYFLKVSRMLIF